MTKEEFKAVEKKLYDYYQSEKNINSLKFKIDIIQDQIEAIEQKISGTKINITDDGLQAVNYEERVQTTSTGISYAEKAAINQIESLEKECVRKKEIRTNLEEILRDMELENRILEYNINFLSESDKVFLEEKYKNKTPEWKLTQELHKSKSAVNRMKATLIEEVSIWIKCLN